jgi:hypothetical protein
VQASRDHWTDVKAGLDPQFDVRTATGFLEGPNARV